mmetsp:Transcript_22467/g.36115  ORF Transcript_22467/g.36115 Transcript_22467/m.36115 type:complete len:92 (-) Transcript_22467:244-519(-)
MCTTNSPSVSLMDGTFLFVPLFFLKIKYAVDMEILKFCVFALMDIQKPLLYMIYVRVRACGDGDMCEKMHNQKLRIEKTLLISNRLQEEMG